MVKKREFFRIVISAIETEIILVGHGRFPSPSNTHHARLRRATQRRPTKTPADHFGSTTVRFARPLLNGHFFGQRHLKMLVAKPDDESPAFSCQ
jgi:hypothetical protein